MNILKVGNLSFRYEDSIILENISFEIKSGDFVGILGPNGCGKTTLLNNINRWLKPHGGSIYINDVDTINMDVRTIAKHLATVPQNTSVDVDFTAKQVVMMGRNPYLKSFESESEEDFNIVENAMKAMDVWHLRQKPISWLSGGERQRVLIARALAQQPKLLLLDEPTSHLDISYQWELLGLLRNLCENKTLTILTVLHDINLASTFCDKVILLKDNEIYSIGTVSEVLTEKNIKEVFNMDISVSFPQDSARPVITFLNQSNIKDLPKPFNKVHVICGGGEGERLLNYLGGRGYEVSAGVVNISDTDYKIAKSLGFTVIEEDPFSPISDEKIKDNLHYINEADAIIVASIPFGHGNIKNISCLGEVASNKKIYILEEQDIKARDYTKGRAAKIYEKIRESAIVCNSLDDLKKLI